MPAPNLYKGKAPLVLSDKREFVLTANHSTLFDVEQVYGKPLHYVFAHLNQGFASAVRALLFVMLKPEHPGVTLDECGEIVFADMEAVSAAVVAAVSAATGGEDRDSPNPRRVAGRTGKRSGGNGARSASNPKRSGKPRRARTG